MDKIKVEMNFCRRCGTVFKRKQGAMYVCDMGHIIFLNSSPAIGLILLNAKDEVLLLERAIDPGLGLLDIPGGFCDGAETLEDAIKREVEEEIGLSPSDYSRPEHLLSHIDPYEYKGETLPVNSSIFWARLQSDKEPVAADDAASFAWTSLVELDMKKVYFPAVRAGLDKVVSRI